MNLQKEKKKKPKRKNPFRFFMYDFVKVTGALPVLVWFRVKRIYETKNAKKHIKGGALICANHISFTDPIVLNIATWYRRMSFVAATDLFSTKLKSWFFKNILCIPIDRQNIGVNSFKDIISALKEKRIVAIFPEGHINKTEETFDYFKSGIVLMAMQAKVPIVPMVIIKREKWWQRQKVIVGEPIHLPEEKMNLTQIDEFSLYIRQQESKLLESYNQRRKNK